MKKYCAYRIRQEIANEFIAQLVEDGFVVKEGIISDKDINIGFYGRLVPYPDPQYLIIPKSSSHDSKEIKRQRKRIKDLADKF